MANNRFEQVDEPQPDAITLSLSADDSGGAARATVTVPAGLSHGRLENDTTSDPLAAVEGFRSAVRLANEMRAPIVVVDPQSVWDPVWGTLYRAN